jgi:hypothetical protein
MEPVLRPYHFVCILVLLAAASFRGTSETATFLANYALSLVAITAGLQLYMSWVNYRSIRNLEALDDAERRLHLLFVHHPDQRAVIERGLAAAPAGPRDGVEVFVPSPALRRVLEWPFWLGAAAVAVVLMLWIRGTEMGWLNVGAGIAGVATTLYAWLRLHTLRHSVEITPFHIAEVYPDGSRRSLKWNALRESRPSRVWRVIRLYPVSGPGHLSLSFDTTRIVRAADLIIRYASPESPPNDPSNQPPS